MELLTFIVLSGTLLTAGLLLHISSRRRTLKPLPRILQFALCRTGILTNIASEWLERFNYVAFGVPRFQPNTSNERSRTIEKIKALTEHHEVAEILSDMIQKDGAGSWPPNANHDHSTWPLPLQPYKEICLELAHLLPQATPSLDDVVNISLIKEFRRRFRGLLNKRVDLVEVNKLLQATESGCWIDLTRDTYNAFYCCIAWSRHAYRWATIPIVKVAQLEKEVDLPIELIEPWNSMQRHFGCPSESGNNTSNAVLNFDRNGTYIHKINTGMSSQVTSGEETFFRVFHDLEIFGVPVYYNMAQAIIAFARGDNVACGYHVGDIASQMRVVIGPYMDNIHDKMIAHSVWLSKIQGFQGWGVGHYDAASDTWETFDGLSGNQVLIFQALDAFLGIEQYLLPRDMERNLPRRQRELCYALRKHSSRKALSEQNREDKGIADILGNFEEILKRLRLFRAAHRTRTKVYLSQPAPERLPMTAGQSLLNPSLDASLEFLDGFMIRRLAQTV